MTPKTTEEAPLALRADQPQELNETAQAIQHLGSTLLTADIDKRIDDMIANQVFLVDGASGRFVTRNEFVKLNNNNQYTVYEADGQQCASSTTDMKKDADTATKLAVSLMPDALTLVRPYFRNVVLYRHVEDKTHQLSLITRWEQGKFVDELVNKPSKYGTRTIPAYAEDIQMSTATVYQFQRFYNLYSVARVKDLVSKKIPWRTIVVLLSVEDDKKRQALEDQFPTLKHEGIEEEVKKHNKATMDVAVKAGKKVDKRGGAAVGTVFKSTGVLLDDAGTKVDEFNEAFTLFLKMPPEKRTAETKASFKTAVGHLRETRKRIDKVIERVEKAIAAHKKG